MPYTGFRHAGVEFIYMLSGEVIYRHGDRNYHLAPRGFAAVRSGGDARAGGTGGAADDVSVDHHVRAGPAVAAVVAPPRGRVSLRENYIPSR